MSAANPADAADRLVEVHDEARRAVEEVLAREEFSGLASQERLLDWITHAAEVIERTLSSLPAAAWVLILAVLLITLFALVGHLAWTAVSLAGRRRDRRTSAGPGSRVEWQGESRPRAADVLAEAARLRDAGLHGEALRRLHLAALLGLDERGLLRFEPEKSDRDYLREVADDVAPDLRELTRRVQRHVYGGAVASAADTDAAESSARRLASEAAA